MDTAKTMDIATNHIAFNTVMPQLKCATITFPPFFVRIFCSEERMQPKLTVYGTMAAEPTLAKGVVRKARQEPPRHKEGRP
jgi:hypothetical protein